MERTSRPMQISYAHTSFHRCLNRGLVSQIFVKELGQSLIKVDSFTELWRQWLSPASTYSNYVIFSIRHIEVSTLMIVLKSLPEPAYVHKRSKDKPKIRWVCVDSYGILTHFPLDKIDTIPQTMFSDAFSWMKSFKFQLRFHGSLFLKSNWQQPSIGLYNGLVLNRRQAIIWTNADPVHWRIYATLGGDGLMW